VRTVYATLRKKSKELTLNDSVGGVVVLYIDLRDVLEGPAGATIVVNKDIEQESEAKANLPKRGGKIQIETD